jgi:hypothetical protein
MIKITYKAVGFKTNSTFHAHYKIRVRDGDIESMPPASAPCFICRLSELVSIEEIEEEI